MRLMIYDETDVTSNLRRLKASGSWPLGVSLLDFNVPVGLSHSWFVGGQVYRALRRVDVCKGFRAWHLALEWLAGHDKVTEIQYWGHGSPGCVWMDGTALRADAFAGPYAEILKKVAARLAPGALVWFRTCATFGADAGQLFARKWAQGLGCRVAGHTHNIGPWQSGLHSLRPGQVPDWMPGEGIAKGDATRPVKMKGSSCFLPHTLNCLRGEVPSDW